MPQIAHGQAPEMEVRRLQRPPEYQGILATTASGVIITPGPQFIEAFAGIQLACRVIGRPYLQKDHFGIMSASDCYQVPE
jgi:hypothetical protein